MNHKMTSIAKDRKTATVLVAIAALAAVLVVSTVAIGSEHIALAHTGVQTYTTQKQKCNTAGGTSGISDLCTAGSSDNITPGPTAKPPGLVTVSKHVVGGPAMPSDFIMGVFSGCNGQTTSFLGSESGTTVSLGPTSCAYSITERGPFIHNYTNTVSGDCRFVLNPGDIQTCIVTNTFVPGDHT
jgi:hypothetical protein